MLGVAARHDVTQLNWLRGASKQGLAEFFFWVWEVDLVPKICSEN